MNSGKHHNLIGEKEIVDALHRLGVVNGRVVVHSSFKSLGGVEGGAETLVGVIMRHCRTVMMPAFCWDSNTSPPPDDRPDRNGCDYHYYDNWHTRPRVPFRVETAGIEAKMGIVPRLFLGHAGVVRSDHAWHSWAVFGEDAGEMVSDHPWSTTHVPLEKISKMDGMVLLVGVGLESCTAIHVAEERVGRIPFIRWAVDRHNVVRRVRASGCARGFHKIFPYVRHLFRETNLGNGRIMVTEIHHLMDSTAEILKQQPDVGRCSDTCIRCRDAILGGPEISSPASAADVCS